MVHEFKYVAPISLDELLHFLAEKSRNGETAVVINGGTDLLASIRAGQKTPDYVVDMKKVTELHELTYSTSEGLSIGATVTVNELLAFDEVKNHYAVLFAGAETLADHQLRNRATVTGNLVTASPCGDTTSPLLTLKAELVIRSASGSRKMPVKDFITGVKRTALKADEIVEKVLIPAESADARGGYKKLKRIKGHDLGIVMVAMYRTDDEIRLSVGSAAPKPVLLEGIKPGSGVAEVQKLTQDAISPIDDVRASAEYRRAMVDAYVKQLMEEVK